jgi:putative ABC transport system permease protein
MNITEGFLTALDSIWANKLRSVLTMLGIIIGVASVIALLGIGTGVSNSITSEINSIGTNLVSISTDLENSGGYPALSMKDVEALADPLNAPALSNVAASVQGRQIVVYGGESARTTVSGVTANYLPLINLDEFQLGDGLTQNDLNSQAQVVVLGPAIASDLFGTEFPIGKEIKINGVGYQVVGVLDESGGGFSGFSDENIYLPLTTAQSRLYRGRTRGGDKAVSDIVAQAASSEQVDAANEQIRLTLREQHGLAPDEEDDFTLFDQASLLEVAGTITGTLTAFLGAIAAISLVVGGIGIMNIMLVSVTERTREIGIRKAVGAFKRDILTQFLLESVSLSLFGGVLGIALGWAVSSAVSSVLVIPVNIAPWTIALSASFAAMVGLVFGIYPAWRAASLRPIEALRYE